MRFEEKVHKRSVINLNLHKMLASISDKKKEKVVIMEAQIEFSMTSDGDR